MMIRWRNSFPYSFIISFLVFRLSQYHNMFSIISTPHGNAPHRAFQQQLLEPSPIAHSGRNIKVVKEVPLIPETLLRSLDEFIYALKPLQSATHECERRTSFHECQSSSKANTAAVSASSDSQLAIDSDNETAERYKKETKQEMQIHEYQQERWIERYQDLVAYYKVHGHCNLPYTYQEDPGLVHWIKRQRHQHKRIKLGKRSNLTQDRVQLLDMIGFNWDSHQNSWASNFESLREFYKNHAHFNVPADYGDKGRLANWIKRQKRQYRLFVESEVSSSMFRERIEKMKKLGFEF
jgi:hypothetical protein